VKTWNSLILTRNAKVGQSLAERQTTVSWCFAWKWLSF